MGNEASLEGDKGALSGLPAGLAPDGKGGFVHVPGGTEVDLSQLSEEDREQLTAAMSRAQARQPGGTAVRRPSEADVLQRSQQVAAGASRGQSGLSKSRTVDAFGQGPVGKPPPGRSPSSLSLFESRFRQEPKDPETKSTGMFGSGFLSGANPLSAVSSMTSSVSSSMSSMGDSVNIPKFGLFGDDGDASTSPGPKQGGKPPGKGPQQGPGPRGPQQGAPPKQTQGPPGQGPKPGQGPPGQGPKPGQGPPGQSPKPGQGPPGQGPKPSQGPPGQGPKTGQGPSGQPGPRQGQGPSGHGPPGQGPTGQGQKQGAPQPQKAAPSPQGPGKPGIQQQGPPGSGAKPGDAAKAGGPLGQQEPGKPGGGLCPLCKTTPLNVGSKDSPNYCNCTECKSQVCNLCGFSPPDSGGKEWLCLNCQMQRAMGGMDPPGMVKPKQTSAPPSPQRQAPGKPGRLLIKQQSTTDASGLTPPTTPKHKSPGATASSPGPFSPKVDRKTGLPVQQRSSPQPSPKAKQESSFFGGLGGISLGGLTDGFGGRVESAKPQGPTKPEESVAGKLFGGFRGGLTEAAKPPAAASQMFGFGSSILSSATNLVPRGEDGKAAKPPRGRPPDSPEDSGPGSPPDSGPGSPPDSPFSAPGSPPDSDSAPDTPPAWSKKAPKTDLAEADGETQAAQRAPGTTALAAPPPRSTAQERCPLCSAELNMGSTDPPNYRHCSECKRTVCDLCGFNTPSQLGEKEWLCINCQTQRATSGQLGDVPPPAAASPKKHPPSSSTPSSNPAPSAVDSKPVVETPDPTQPPPETKVETPQPTPTPTPNDKPLSDDHLAQPSVVTQSNDLRAIESVPPPATPVSESFINVDHKDPAVEQLESSSGKLTGEQPPGDPERVHSTPMDGELEHSASDGADKKKASVEEALAMNSEMTRGEVGESSKTPVTLTEKVEEIRAEESATVSVAVKEKEHGEANENATAPLEVSGQTPKPGQRGPANAPEPIVEKSPVPPVKEPANTVPAEIDQSKEEVVEKSVEAPLVPEQEGNLCNVTPQPAPTEQTPEVVTIVTLRDLNCASPPREAESIASVEAKESTSDITFELIKDEPDTAVDVPTVPTVTAEGENLVPAATIGDARVPKAVEIQPEPTAGPSKLVENAREIPNEVTSVEQPVSHFEEKCDSVAVEPHPADDKTTEKVRELARPLLVEEKQATVEKQVTEKVTAEEGPLDDEPDPASTPIAEAERVDPAIDVEKKELKAMGETPLPKAAEPVQSVPVCETLSEEEKRIYNEHKPNSLADPAPAEGSLAMVSLAEKCVLKKSLVEAESVEQEKCAKENHMPADTISKPQIKSMENVDAKEAESNVEIVLSASVISERPGLATICDEKTIQIKTDAEEQVTHITDEDAQQKSRDSALIGRDGKRAEKVVEQNTSDKEKLTESNGDSKTTPSDEQKQLEHKPKENVFCDEEGRAECDVRKNVISKGIETPEWVCESYSKAPALVAKPDIPVSVVSEQHTHDCPKEENADTGEEKQADAKLLEKYSDAEAEAKQMNKKLKGPGEITQENSPTSPSDFAKLESTVLPILEAQQASPQPEDGEGKPTDSLKVRRKLEVLPLSPDSPSSEDDREPSENRVVSSTTQKKLLVPADVRADSLDDSSESFGKESPMSGDDEDFIRKQIIEMSENEDASPSDEENIIRRKIREEEKKRQERSASGKTRRLLKKSSMSPDDEEENQLSSLLDEPNDKAKDEGTEPKKVEPEAVIAVRKFRTIELNATTAPTDDGELEMESLTDSPDDRSRGDGSSSLHASSFTPGTSPTSLSSLDEDSDSSSPSHAHSGEAKQHRKAKHRQPGQVLPTIEDSSEEEELREEEELLREQEKQKGSGKKSKKDKEEIRAQRRRERPKTPPSNLSPIEDASPTEELRQEAEMEEIRRSSCSDFSPSIESEPEGFQIHASKIAAVQKTYQLPTTVSLHSPTEDQNADKTQTKILKTADQTYEEIMLRAKSPTVENMENPPVKASLYGGMLIEDYAYETLIDNANTELGEQNKIAVPAHPKKLRSPDEVYEDMVKKRKEFMQLEQEYQKMQPVTITTKPEIVLQPAESCAPISSTVTIGKDGKALLDAEAAYEELMKRVLTPGTSPTQQDPELDGMSRRALHPIPDLKVTQCSSGEVSSDEEMSVIKKEEVKSDQADTPPVTSTAETEPITVICEVPPSCVSEPKPPINAEASHSDIVDLSSATPQPSLPVVSSVSPLPTVPQYTPTVSSIVSTAPPVPPKPNILHRANSQEKNDSSVTSPLPPPTQPKPTVFPRKPPVPLPPQATATPIRPDPLASTTDQVSTARQPVALTYKTHVPPPIPPKPPTAAGVGPSHRPGDGGKPPIAPKPSSQPPSPAHVHHPLRPTVLATDPADVAMNLSPSAENKPFHPSPKSPSSPRYASNLRDTYVVITLPSQPSSPVYSVSTQAPSGPSPASPSRHAQQQHAQPQPPPPRTQTTRVPLAYTRVTESIESQEICGPEKHVSSSCHIIEAISASAQPPVVMPNHVSQVVTTEVQRTTVSVVHERTPPPMPAPRANGVPISMEKPKTQLPAQNGQSYHHGEVVDLRTMKADQESDMKGVDLSSAPESRRQSVATDISVRQNSAVQSPVVNLSTESSTVSIVTDSITIVTCAATIQHYDNVDTSAFSAPLQLTKNKAFEPVSQIIYRPIDSQPSTCSNVEIPINLSVGSGTSGGIFPSAPVTIAPMPAAGCVANGLTTGTATFAGAVDLSTAKPFNCVVSVDTTSSDVVTVVDDGKPVDLTAGRRSACCDVVYKLPFAGSCATQQPTTPLPEDRFGYRDDHYQYDRSPYGMRGFGGIKPSMSDTNLAEAGLFLYKSKNSYHFNVAAEGAVDLTSAKISDAGEAVDYSKKGGYAAMTIPPYSQAGVTGAAGTILGTNSVLRSSNGVVYSSVSAPNPSTYAITTQPGSIFSTTHNTMHTSDTMPSLSNLQDLPLKRSHSFVSTTSAGERDAPLNLELSKDGTASPRSVSRATTSLSLDTYTDASLEAIAASLEALSSPMVPGDGQYQAERDRLEMEKLKQQRLAEELEWERQEIQRFREQEQMLVQKELEELQCMKQQILAQQEEERQAHLMLQKETYAQQQQQLEQIQRLQEQLRLQLEEQKLRQMYPGGDIPGYGPQEAIVIGPDGTVLARKITDSGCQTDEEDDSVSKAYTTGRKKRSSKKSVDSCVQTDDEDQDEWEAQTTGRRSRPRTARGDRSGHSEMSIQAHTEISIQTDTEGNITMDTRMELSDSERTSPKKRPTPLEIGQSPNLKADPSTLQAPKSPKVLFSPISPCISPSKSLEFVSYENTLDDTSPQKLRGTADPSKVSPVSPRGPKAMQRSMSDPKASSPTGEERASGTQHGDSLPGKGSGGTPTGTQKKVKRTLPNPPSEDESTASGQTAYSTGSARRRMCRNSNLARAKILQDIDRELDLVERESSKLRKKQAELDEEEKEIDAKLRYLEMGINRRKDVLLKEREKRERAYLQSVAEDRDYMSDSEVSNIRDTRGGCGDGEDEEIGGHGLERPRTAPQSELDDYVPPQTTHEYGKYSQYQYPQTHYQPSLFQTPQSYQSQSIYSSVPSLTSAQQQSYHQMLLIQQKAARQAALLSELDATKYDVISRQPDPTSSAYLGVKYDKYGNHLDLRALESASIAGSPMSTVSDSYYTDVDHHTPRSYMLLEDAAELAKSSAGLSSSYSLAERELVKAEKLLRRSNADLGSADYLGSASRLHTYGKTPDEEDTMEEPYELKLLKQQLKQEFRRSATGTESLEQLTGLSHHYYAPSSGLSSYSQRHYPKSDKYSISRLTLEKQAAKQLPASMLYQKQKTLLIDPKISTKYSSITDTRGLDADYNYLGSTSASPRSSRLLQDEITFGLRKNIAEQQKYLGSTLGANLAGSLNLGQSLGLDSAYPSGSRSRPTSRPTSCYGLDLSIKRDPSNSSLRLKGDGEASGDGSNYQTPSGRTKPTSLPIVQSGRGRIPIVAQNSEEESPLSPVGQPMGMARASAGPLPPISADSRDQFGSCLSLQDSQQQHIREEPTRGRSYALLDELQSTMPDSEAYHLRREEADWFDKSRDGRSENGQDKRQSKGPYYPFPHLRVKLQRDPKDRVVSGNGLGIRVVGGKEVPGSHGDIGAYVAKVLPGGAAEQTGKILEGMQVLEWNGVPLTGKTYEEVQGLVGQQCNDAELCVRLDLNMLADTEGSQHLDIKEHSKGERPPRSPGVDPQQLAAELQKVSQQQAPPTSVSSSCPALPASAASSPGQPGSPSLNKKRHSSKSAEGTKIQSHPVSGEIQLQIHYDKQMGNLIVHVLQARNLSPRDNSGYTDPFVKVYLLPGRGQVMVVQNASAENKRRSKHTAGAGKSLNPEWNQTVIYKNIHLEQLRKKTLEVSVWDYDKCSSNDFLGEVLIDLSNTAQLDNIPHWLPLKEQSEGEHDRRSHSGQGRQQQSSKPSSSSQHASPKTAGSTHNSQDSPKSSVIKSRSHGVFPDPAKDTQAPTIEKSHSSPGTSKPSLSEGPSERQRTNHGHGHGHNHHRQHSRSHDASRSGKSVSQHQHQRAGTGTNGGAAIATGEAPQQPQQQQSHQQQPPQRPQPSQRGHLSLRRQRHSVVGVLTIQRTQPDWLPPLPSVVSAKGSRADGRRLTLRKAMSEERPRSAGARSSYRSGDAPVTAASLDSGLSGSAYSLLDEEGETNEVDSAIFQVPRFGKMPNGTDVMKSPIGHSESEGKTQVIGEIKIALKKEMKSEGEHLVLEILQCRNITYKFKTADHLPDLYVKLYVVNIATQKRVIKKKSRVCRHDREPSFNETFRFCMNPTGHSLQLFLVSNGGKFVKKTLIGEAYVWLDKVDLRKRVVSWHKLLASTSQIHS